MYEYDNNEHDTIQLNDDIRASDLDLTRNGDNLVISMESSGDSLTVNNWFKHSGYQVEELLSSDNAMPFSAEQINEAFERYSANSNVTIDLDNLAAQTLTIC